MTSIVRRFDDFDESPISEDLRASSQRQSLKKLGPRSTGRNWNLEEESDESPIKARYQGPGNPPKDEHFELRQSWELESMPRKSKDSWASAGSNKVRSSREYERNTEGNRCYDPENRTENELNRISSSSANSPPRGGGMRKENRTMKHASTTVPEPEPESVFYEDSIVKGKQEKTANCEEGKFGDRPRRSGHYYESKQGESDEEVDDIEVEDIEEGKSCMSTVAIGKKGAMTHLERESLESTKIPFILVAHRGWTGYEHVRCFITRNRSSLSNKMYPTYELFLECTGQSIILAQKMQMNATSNYHLFDMTRGTIGKELSKKSCNYIGKLRAQDGKRTRYTHVTNAVEREESAGICFDRPGLFQHFKEGNQPRKLRVVLPPLDSHCTPIPKVPLFSISRSILAVYFRSYSILHTNIFDFDFRIQKILIINPLKYYIVIVSGYEEWKFHPG